MLEIVSEYDQEIPQSQTADNPTAPRGRTAQPDFSDQLNKKRYKKLNIACISCNSLQVLL